MTNLAGIETHALNEPATIRLISTAYIDEPAMAPLADNPDELALLEELEGLTSQRRLPRLPIPGGLDTAELLGPSHGYGWSYVNAAFCYTRASGNRFNGPERGAWYACYGEDAAQTAQAEVGWHLTQELKATGVFENVTAYRELIAGFSSQFHALTSSMAEAMPALHPDPAIGYAHGQALAREIFNQGGQGLTYPSVRREQGCCLAAFRPHLVQNIRQGERWTFTWSGSPDPQIVAG